MPELPEVETIRRVLAPQLIGRTAEAVDIRNAQVIAHPEPDAFVAGLQGQRIADLSRRGKYLTLRFASGDCLTLHLRMTGRLLVMPADEPVEKHTHLLFGLSDGRHLRFIDVRRFGRLWFLRAQEDDVFTGQSEPGPEPASPALTAAYLEAKLGARRRPVKEMLHDQTIVSGIGNIYSDEILFASGIHPQTQCAALTAMDWARLADKIREVILRAIDVNAMVPEEYLRGKGKEYRNTPCLRVYGRAGRPCPVCGNTLEKTIVCGRSSCYCPCCQRIKSC